jgi:hypothetical protein
MLVGLMVPALLAAGALGVDITHYQLAQLQTQYAADAAAHAAFVRYRSTGDLQEGISAAEHVLAHNLVAGAPAQADEIDFGSWVDDVFNPNSSRINAVYISVSRRDGNAVPTLFAGFLGVPTLDTSATSTTAGRNRQIMIVQDITGSFRDDIANARAANLAFLDYMAAHPYPQDMVGMTTFVGGVEATPWSPLEDIEYANQIRTRWETLDWCNCLEGPLQAINGDSTDYCVEPLCPIPSWPEYCETFFGGHDTRPTMVDCWSVGKNTAPGPGIVQAADELLTHGNDRSFRAMILISDGLPCCGEDTEPRKQAAVDAADYAWANGIHVWSVVYNQGGGDFSFLQSLTRGAGTAYETPDSEQLEAILLDIASSIPVVTVQ